MWRVTVRWIAALAALVVVAMPGSAGAAVFPFPSEHSSVTVDGVSDTFTATRNVTRAILLLQPSPNGVAASQTWALEIGPRRVATVDVPAGSSEPLSLDVSFSPITGPTYDVALLLLTDRQDGSQTFATGSLELLDTLPPETHVDAGGSLPGGPLQVRFSSRSTDAVRFECSLDGSPFAQCVSPMSYAGLRVGPHPFLVRAIDDVGNVDPTPARWTARVTPGASCSNSGATVRAGTVTTLKLACNPFGAHIIATSIVRPPRLGALGAIDQARQVVSFTAPRVAGMTSFTYRDPTSNVGTFNLTISGPVGSDVSAGWRVARDHTTLRRLAVWSVPAWGTVTVRCLHKGCSYHRSWPAAASGHRALNLVAELAHRRLRPGTVVQIRIAAPYATAAKVVRYTIRAHRPPLRTMSQPPRSKK
jgi:hypothetical protein